MQVGNLLFLVPTFLPGGNVSAKVKDATGRLLQGGERVAEGISMENPATALGKFVPQATGQHLTNGPEDASLGSPTDAISEMLDTADPSTGGGSGMSE